MRGRGGESEAESPVRVPSGRRLGGWGEGSRRGLASHNGMTGTRPWVDYQNEQPREGKGYDLQEKIKYQKRAGQESRVMKSVEAAITKGVLGWC